MLKMISLPKPLPSRSKRSRRVSQLKMSRRRKTLVIMKTIMNRKRASSKRVKMLMRSPNMISTFPRQSTQRFATQISYR